MGFNLQLQSFHFACFACRRSFKKHVQREIDFHTGNFVTYRLPLFTCPDCGQPLQLQGRDFAAPRRDKPHRWQQLKEQQIHELSHFMDTFVIGNLERSDGRRRHKRKVARMNARIDREKLQMIKSSGAKE